MVEPPGAVELVDELPGDPGLVVVVAPFLVVVVVAPLVVVVVERTVVVVVVEVVVVVGRRGR